MLQRPKISIDDLKYYMFRNYVYLLSLGRQRPENRYEFMVSLVYTFKARL